MTVRCDACGTENRDKAMFCRGCAGKMPAFVPTKRPAGGTPTPAAPPIASSSATAGRVRFGLTGPSILALALLMAVLGAVVAWFALTSTAVGTPAIRAASAVVERLPPEASLSTGETLADGSDPDVAATAPASPSSSAGAVPPAAPDVVPGTNPPPEVPSTEADPIPPARTTNRRAALPPTPGSSRASDPRAGCEHLFFAFAARCEANHCQLPAYARHPRCEVVREQRRRDEARRNSLPTS